MEHVELGMDLVKQAINDLSGVGKADDEPKLNGRFIIVSLSLCPKTKGLYDSTLLEDLEVEESDDDSEENGDPPAEDPKDN